jgi:hypothetical protein
MVIKLSAEQIASLGISDPKDFSAALAKLIESSNAPKTEQKVIAIADAEAIFAARFTAIEKNISDLKTAVAAVDVKTITEVAAKAGSESAAKALGKVGASGGDVVNANPTDGKKDGGAAKALITEGKFDEAWSADANIQAEWPDKVAYVGYMKAVAKGGVKIFAK